MLVTRKEAIEQGKIRYFTGKPCCSGHVSERVVANKTCLVCIAIRSSKYRKNNPDLCKKQWKSWYEKNSEKFKEYTKQWSLKNPDKVKEYRKRISKEAKLKRDEYRLTNKVKIREGIKRWEHANKEKVKASQSHQRARRKSVEGKFTGEQVKQLFIKQNGICAICKVVELTLQRKMPNTLHCDHIMPISKGGLNWIENIQLTCGPCNRAKGNKIMDVIK